MPENSCTYRNPLVRDGVSQSRRMPEALDPAYAKVDERSLADLLEFVVRYAEELQYYQPDNIPSGDWRPFFSGDITSVIALLTVEDPTAFNPCIEKIEKVIFDDDTTYQNVRRAFKTLFDIIGTLAVQLDSWYGKVPAEYQFQEHLHVLITSQLRTELEKCIGYYKGALSGTNLVDKEYLDEGDFCNTSIEHFTGLETGELQEVWIGETEETGNTENWATFYTSVEENDTIYLPPGGTIKQRVRSGFPPVKKVAASFITALKRTRERSPGFIEETLTRFSGHEPQMGLMLTFLKLFRHAQDHINTLTGKHLDFYYEEVLKLDRKEAVPDRVDLLVELAKHVDTYKLESGTLFKAGKDAKGKDVFYKSLSEVVLNKASVVALKSVYVDKEDQYRVYEKSIANSKEGTGTPLDNPPAGWKAFGESQRAERPDGSFEYLAGDEATMQFSEVGFSISSPILHLSEGTRTITLEILCNQSPKLDKSTRDRLFRCFVTTEKEWLDLEGIEGAQVSLESDTSEEGPMLKLEITLPRSVSPVTGYEKEMHGGEYQTEWPVLKLVLNQNLDPGKYGYATLKNITVQQVNITVEVQGMKSLVLQNELGILDPSKPFQPFGPSPSIGSAFLIGSTEVFQKKLDSVTLHVQWHEWPEAKLEDHYNYSTGGETGMVNPVTGYSPANSSFKANLQILREGAWKPEAPQRYEKTLFPSNFTESPTSISANSGNEPEIQMEPDAGLGPIDQFDVSLKRGFIRLVLSAPQQAFGHKLYPTLLTQQVINEKTVLPREPYTPKISSIELDYKARATVEPRNTAGFEKRTSYLFHNYPFGEKEVHSALTTTGDTIPLLPRFSHAEGGGINWHDGEFFVGISGLKPPQQLSLLFRVAEGSADPSLDKLTLKWFYLAGNHWEVFQPEELVRDSTNDFLTTGIVRINIPKQATNNSTLFPGAHYWIKAAVSGNPDAVCRLVDVRAQAITAEFVDHDNDPNFLDTTLKAGTISKLKTKRSEIKKIQQPYASEGGKIPEQDIEFYRRVSERLRHKERGVSIWDYERLVMEHFPEVYKAKCVNHSTYNYDLNGGKVTAEFAPGYVTLVVVPDLKNKNAVEPLKPRLSLNVRDKIEKFISAKISAFAAQKLKVINPLFEQVQVECYVNLVDEVDEGHYRQKLVDEIARFLSPWAFGEGKDIAFGGGTHKSLILNFVEERPYVRYVTDFKMHHFVEDTLKNRDLERITVTTARSILVSHKLHIINEHSTCTIV
ncbi:baseplate J/gp47 family protein [Halalkalibaculum sp. DA3122]|uniref:baseplate J/gp47 family protein n=1 Tax=unclassified Halalkalibaculum TaxID=2964617 RepID=UPI0037548197